jgi:hypothetical protein
MIVLSFSSDELSRIAVAKARGSLLACHDNLIMPSINPPALECRPVDRSTPQ